MEGETWSNTKPETKPLVLIEAHERKLQHFKLRYGPGLVFALHLTPYTENYVVTTTPPVWESWSRAFKRCAASRPATIESAA